MVGHARRGQDCTTARRGSLRSAPVRGAVHFAQFMPRAVEPNHRHFTRVAAQAHCVAAWAHGLPAGGRRHAPAGPSRPRKGTQPLSCLALLLPGRGMMPTADPALAIAIAHARFTLRSALAMAGRACDRSGARAGSRTTFATSRRSSWCGLARHRAEEPALARRADGRDGRRASVHGGVRGAWRHPHCGHAGEARALQPATLRSGRATLTVPLAAG